MNAAKKYQGDIFCEQLSKIFVFLCDGAHCAVFVENWTLKLSRGENGNKTGLNCLVWRRHRPKHFTLRYSWSHLRLSIVWISIKRFPLTSTHRSADEPSSDSNQRGETMSGSISNPVHSEKLRGFRWTKVRHIYAQDLAWPLMSPKPWPTNHCPNQEQQYFKTHWCPPGVSLCSEGSVTYSNLVGTELL